MGYIKSLYHSIHIDLVYFMLILSPQYHAIYKHSQGGN